MKNKILYLLAASVSLFAAAACNEDDFLKEVPKDFISIDNAYVTESDYQAALTGLYNMVRYYEYTNEGLRCMLGTDVAYNARRNNDRMGNLVNEYKPENERLAYYWDNNYKLIKNANTIISRVMVSDLTDAQKEEISAEARFFRAFGYRTLVYYYGGVPLIKEEVVVAKKDYVRAGKDEVLRFMREDFEYAAAHLPGIDAVMDGKLSDLVAKHYLAETCISLGDFDNAIKWASDVIDSPSTGLMKERFGSRIADVPEGDVYFDLFQRKNQNRKSAGNKEALWVIQFEEDVPGGYTTTASAAWNYPLERNHCPATYLCTDPDGNTAMLGGNGRSDFNCGGRGVSFMRTTDWHLNQNWDGCFDTDMRNSAVNIVRTAVYDDPKSPWFGQSIISGASMSSNYKSQDWRWYPWLTKATSPGDHPSALYADKTLKTLTAAAGTTYADQYMLRLAETYLLRAEAYLFYGRKDLAAADINEVRGRANATPVSQSKVTLDYILDERARELTLEERRKLTLYRTGTFLKRTRKYNEYQGEQIKDYMALFPIPYSFIEANTGAHIEQNPGYTEQ
ncbi:MAG: RagB/SusD family nutrient uptake outer membrane protein [Bacteroidales bacterium]|nr:RagB/SusD family nutrient uptake outer membrane protein [Bacteroidales bacterium]